MKSIPSLAALVLFGAGQPQPAEKKQTFTGEFDFHETLEYVQNGVCDLDLRANIPFEIS